GGPTEARTPSPEPGRAPADHGQPEASATPPPRQPSPRRHLFAAAESPHRGGIPHHGAGDPLPRRFSPRRDPLTTAASSTATPLAAARVTLSSARGGAGSGPGSSGRTPRSPGPGSRPPGVPRAR